MGTAGTVDFVARNFLLLCDTTLGGLTVGFCVRLTRAVVAVGLECLPTVGLLACLSKSLLAV